MSEIELGYIGQERAARRYLMSLDGYGTEKVALMTSGQVQSELGKVVSEKGLVVVYQDQSQDIGLVPEDVADQITWLSR